MIDNPDILIRILLATALGAAIGLEREINDHPSGLRTFIAVTLGSCLFTLVGVMAFGSVLGSTPGGAGQDITRVAAQVVTGIGFLGAGSIMKADNTIKGLTSAAGLWVSAAIGMSVAFGLYFLATLATVTLLFVLTIMRIPRHYLRQKLNKRRATVLVQVPAQNDVSSVITMISALPYADIENLSVEHPNSKTNVHLLRVALRVFRGSPEEALQLIKKHPEVEDVELL